MQLGQYCNTAKCYECPIYEAWKANGEFNNSCVECLRFPDIAEKMVKAMEGEKNRK